MSKLISKTILAGIAGCITILGGIGLLSHTGDDSSDTKAITRPQQVENIESSNAGSTSLDAEDTVPDTEPSEDASTGAATDSTESYEAAPSEPQAETQIQPEPAYVAPAQTYTAPEPQPTATTYQESVADCNIKGNVNSKNHTKIYHVPGSRYYDSTIVDPSKGDQWFCSVEEAVATGFRAPKR